MIFRREDCLREARAGDPQQDKSYFFGHLSIRGCNGIDRRIIVESATRESESPSTIPKTKHANAFSSVKSPFAANFALAYA